MWIWRADHGNGGTVGWTTNTAANGLVVNGNNVTMYGLFVEHYQQYQVIWNGNGGRTYFFQNEIPYDVPNQASLDQRRRRAGLGRLQGRRTRHQPRSVGPGQLLLLQHQPERRAAATRSRSRQTPNVRFHDMVTVSLGGTGTIAHVINNTGGPSNSATNVANWVNYP